MLKNLKFVNKIFYKKHSYKFTTNNNTNKKFNLLFFGNDEISLPTLNKIYEEMHQDNSMIDKLGIVSTPLENKKSVQSIFHKFVEEKKIEKFELNIKSEENLKNSWRELNKEIMEKNYNLGIVASFGKMIPGTIITSFKNGIYVMHPSLLPRYRGASPIQHALMNREKKTGVTLVEASIGKFDAGDIILHREVNIEPFYRFKELSLVLSHLGADCTMEFLKDFDKKIKNKFVQDETNASMAKLILSNEFVYLDFVNENSEKILSIYKSFYGSQLEPFTKMKINNQERFVFFDNLIQVTPNSEMYKLNLHKIDPIAKSGQIYFDLKQDRNNIYIKSNDGWFVTNKIKMDGLTWTPGEKIISKVFMNLRFKDRTNSSLNFSMLPKKFRTINITEENKNILLDNKNIISKI